MLGNKSEQLNEAGCPCEYPALIFLEVNLVGTTLILASFSRENTVWFTNNKQIGYEIFTSWSGIHSQANALNIWLKRVIQAVKPFYSPEIDKGAKWNNELDATLEGTNFDFIPCSLD